MPLIPLKTPKLKFWKMKKFAGDIIILHMCIKNHNHMMYGSWDTEWGTKFFVILAHFLPFQPLDNLENQNFNIEKNTWRYYHFTHLHHKWKSYDVWFLRYGGQQTIFCHSVSFFALLSLYGPRKSKFSKKMDKTPEDIILQT